MTKVKVLFTSLLAVAMLVPTVAFAEENSKSIKPLAINLESEPNDTISRADRLSSDPVVGTISTVNDVDFYKTQKGSLWTGGNITIKLSNIPDDHDYDLIVYDENEKIIGRSSNSGNADEAVTFFLPNGGGTYYAKVYSVSGFSTSEHYMIERIE